MSNPSTIRKSNGGWINSRVRPAPATIFPSLSFAAEAAALRARQYRERTEYRYHRRLDAPLAGDPDPALPYREGRRVGAQTPGPAGTARLFPGPPQTCAENYLLRDDRVWMSLSPVEIESLAPHVARIRGHVVIALGPRPAARRDAEERSATAR